MKYDFVIADNADTPHVALTMNGGKLLTLPWSRRNDRIIEELAAALNGAEENGFETLGDNFIQT